MKNNIGNFPHAEEFKSLDSSDPLDDVYQLLGGDDSDEFFPLSFDLVQLDEAKKRALLGELNDIHRHSTWPEVNEVIVEAGFEVIQEHSYEDISTDQEETLAVFTHTNLPILLIADSYQGRFSSIELYCAIDSTNLSAQQNDAIKHLHASKTPISEISIQDWEPGDQLFHQLNATLFDGLRLRMELLQEADIPFVDWPTFDPVATFCLLDRNEKEFPYEVRGNIQTERLMQLPDKVKKYIGLDELPDWYNFTHEAVMKMLGED